jgi:hypothetical protein
MRRLWPGLLLLAACVPQHLNEVLRVGPPWPPRPSCSIHFQNLSVEVAAQVYEHVGSICVPESAYPDVADASRAEMKEEACALGADLLVRAGNCGGRYQRWVSRWLLEREPNAQVVGFEPYDDSRVVYEAFRRDWPVRP